MKVLAQNDAMEFLQITEAENRPLFMTHNRLQLDSRAEWTLRLLQSWGMAAAMGDIISEYACEEHKNTKRVPPQELMMRICEVVDAAWNEMLHRGWVLPIGSLGK